MPSWIPRTNLEWAYFGSTAAQAAVIVPVQVTVLVRYLQWVNPVVYQVPLSYVVPLAIAVTTLGALFQVVLTLDAFRIKNNIQLCMQCIFNVCLSIAQAMQYTQIKGACARTEEGYGIDMQDKSELPFAKNDWKFWQHVSPALLTCLIVSFISSAAICGLAYAVCREFAWALYEQVSPDRKIRKRYFHYQIYLVILKFTLFFIIGFIIVYDFIDVHFEDPEFSLTLAIIPAALVHVGLAVYFIRIETRIGMSVVLLGHAAEFAWLVSRLVILYGHGLRSKTLLKDEMVFLSSMGLIFSTGAIIAGSMCFSSFDKGLKPYLLGQVQSKKRNDDFEIEYEFQRMNHNVPVSPGVESRRFALD